MTNKKNWPTLARPSVGPPYVRCPVCQEQVFVRMAPRRFTTRPAATKDRAALENVPTVTKTQEGFSAAVALAKHAKAKHGEGSDDDD